MSGILSQLLAGLVGGTHAAQQIDQRHTQEALLAEERARRLAADQAQAQDRQEARYLQGFRPGTAPDTRGILSALQLGSGIADMNLPGANPTAAVATAENEAVQPGRFQQVNPSTYLDTTATPEAQATRRQQSAAVIAMRAADDAAKRQEVSQGRQFAQQEKIAGIHEAGADRRAQMAADRAEQKAGQLPPQQANQVKTQQTALLNMHKAISALRDAVREGGMAVLPGAHQARIRALQADAQIQFKEAANLGALSGPDMGLVESALGNATNPLQLLRGGQSGVLSSLDAAEQSLRHRAETMKQVYGVDMPGGGLGTVQPQQGNAPTGDVHLGDTAGKTVPVKRDPLLDKYGLTPKGH